MTVLAVDVDGNIQVAEAEPVEVPEGFSADVAQEYTQSTSPVANSQAMDGEFIDLQDVVEPDQHSVDQGGTPYESPMSMEPPEQASYSEPDYSSMTATIPPQGPVKEPSTPKPARPRTSVDDIKDFGNKDSSSAGPISYSVTLENVDLALTRKQLQRIFSEPQFGWNAFEIMQQVKGGTLVLEGLSPAQAVMLLKLVKGLNLQVSWRQHVYS